jgi:lipoprotein signal peptidase
MNTKSKRSFLWLLLTLAMAGLVLDQVGKYEVFRNLHDEAVAGDYKAVRTVIPGALTFHVEFTRDRWEENELAVRTWSGEYQPHVNRGAFLGFGNGDDGRPNGNILFAIISVVAAVAILWWGRRPAISQDPFLCVALGLILGGTLGNLYDRIIFDGVRDYLYWSFIIKTAVFNIADFLLVCGACLLLIQAFLGKHKTQEQPVSNVVASTEMAQVKSA